MQAVSGTKPYVFPRPDCHLKNARDVIVLLATTINQVRRGQIDPRIANTVGYLSATLLKAEQVGNLEERVSALEIATRNGLQSRLVLDTEEFQFIQKAPDDQREATGAN